MGKFERKWMGLLGLAAGTLLALPLSAQAAGAPEGMKEVAGNGQLTLYLNEEDASVNLSTWKVKPIASRV